MILGAGGEKTGPGQGHDGQDLLEAPEVNGEAFASSPILCQASDWRCLQPPSFPTNCLAAPSSQPFFTPSRQNNKLSPFLGLLPSFQTCLGSFIMPIKK